MNNGKPLFALYGELQRQATVSQDYLADTTQIQMLPSGHILLDGKDSPFHLSKNAHKQLADWANIPHKYYQRIKQVAPDLLAENVNHWLSNTGKPTRRLIRTLDGNMRAFLSSKYRRIDNLQIAEAILPIMINNPDIRIESCDITDDRLYIKCVFPRVEGEVLAGDVVQSGVVVSNSEVGSGALTVSPLVYRLVCTNGMIVNAANNFGLKQTHVGRQLSADDDNFEIFSTETIEADEKALMLKLRDAVSAASKQVVFDKILDKMREAAGSTVIKQPIKAVEELSNTFALRDTEKNSFLTTLIRDSDYSRWGAINAVTEIANNLDDYERSTELETIGGKLLDAPKQVWEQIADAA